jgi:hypothetical protein
VSALARLPAVALVGVLLLGGLAGVSATSGPHGITVRAPQGPTVSFAHSAPTAAARAAATPTAAARPAGAQCTPTPGGTPNWDDNAEFFDDALVTFSVPGDNAISGSNFDILPCDNVVPTYTNGFWMNVSTNVDLTAAYVKIWGTSWPAPKVPTPDIPGYSPSDPQQVTMSIAANTPSKASFYFNDYRYFWPGDQVYFNITLLSDSADPQIIYSAQGAYSNAIQWSGGYNNATWAFYVASPFSPMPLLNGETANFSQVISISTTPDVLSSPAYEPNDDQSIQIFLAGSNTTGTPLTIPRAQLSFTLTGAQSGVYSDDFAPSNHSFAQLSIPLGPYPATRLSFNVTAWLPWEGGAIDRIYSTVYAFNWTNQGGWWCKSCSLTDNVDLGSVPDVTGGTAITDLGTGTPVNVTIHEPIENVTISSAALHFRYTDANGGATGTLPMIPAGQNTSYVVIPGLPPGGQIQFSVEAKDINDNPVSSGNYTYAESGPLNASIPPGYGLFYFEAIDVATGTLVTNLNFTLSNGTWTETRVGTPLGFAVPVPISGGGELPVTFGTNYTVTVRAFGQSQTWTGAISSQTPFVVTFLLSSGPVAPTYAAPIAGLSIAGVFGLIGSAAIGYFVLSWFRERRKKIEAEQRRISL